MMNAPMSRPAGRRPRPIRRGRAALVAAAGLVLATAVLFPLLTDIERVGSRTLLIPEGRRAAQVYEAVDRVLGERPGTTRRAVGTAGLNLPAAARGNPEGYLFPATYPVGPDSTPASLLARMVDTANQRFAADKVAAGARRVGTTVYETVAIASIVQAEAATAEDMGKVSRVIHNRLARGMPLQMDSTLNYALRRTTVDTSLADTRINSPYNSYVRKGLPPTPIDNPGDQALDAALAPTPGKWLFFVTVAPGDTRFSTTFAEHQRHVADFNAHRADERAR
ncbi:endolytic transglycosylase MltG [Streptomyces qinzhouensis]|uniref:Endolytic murein transglycosylase n=1 Tax=Streptomyces qinzhouensis TaxID=2599401 RepID=A0A5B8J5J1_9ACTN|nr:endolytic transglycosylase MltG [Streptomyces qinzhouensis]QDY75664.1 endolytic transglycosylase MltG [Streptomyces qinzhouensis]